MVGPIHSAPSTQPLQQARVSVDQSLNRISSGQRLNGAADDAAGLAISETFSAQTRGQYQAIRNAGLRTASTPLETARERRKASEKDDKEFSKQGGAWQVTHYCTIYSLESFVRPINSDLLDTS